MNWPICGRSLSRELRVIRSNHTVVLCGLLLYTVLTGGCSIRSPFVSDELLSPIVEAVNHDEVVQSIFLIGDAGKPSAKRREPTLAALTRQASHRPEKSLILFLGDNIYSYGMPEESDDGRLEAERKINEQVRVVEESGARAIFMPGNHDWRGGWEAILRQEEFLVSKENANVLFLPHGGCPGPEVIDLSDRLRLVILDTQWWLEEGSKPEHPDSDCGPDSKEEVIDSLAQALHDAGERYVLVVGHHPLDTHGRHGGFFDWKDHLFPLRVVKSWMWIPLPGLGSLYPLARSLGITNQDLSSSAYRDMKARIEGVLSERPPLAYVAGHEHVLQVLRGSGPYLLVISGSGTSDHSPTLTTGSNTLFAHMHPGFVRIDFLRDGSVRLGVIVPIDGHGASKEVFSMWLVAVE
ncbi:MAG: metallophosphoesterase [Bacteroidota bacterium]